MGKGKIASGESEGAHGYLMSALVFAGITALWAVIVRSDPYYRLVEFFGARVPATMIAYLALMPLAGFLIGRWRYDGRHAGAAAGYAGKLVARFVHFTYVHLLIVLFTVAMATDYFLGFNIDDQIRKIDDRMFDIAARFAPWLAAYLTGFNLGRAMRRTPDAPLAAGEDHSDFSASDEEKTAGKAKAGRVRSAKRAEPTLEPSTIPPGDLSDRGDLEPAPAALTSSGLPSASADVADDQPGFLPPQDLDKLRPGLNELR